MPRLQRSRRLAPAIPGARAPAYQMAPLRGSRADGDGATVAQYTGALNTYGPLVSQRRSSTSRFFHPSVLGSIETLTGADAGVTDTYILDAWGVQRASTGSTTNPFRYIGALGYYTEPDLGLAYVRARWLRPATGSWLSVDPAKGQMRYGYVGGRATAEVDPSGLLWPSLWCFVPLIGWTICLFKYGWPWAAPPTPATTTPAPSVPGSDGGTPPGGTPPGGTPPGSGGGGRGAPYLPEFSYASRTCAELVEEADIPGAGQIANTWGRTFCCESFTQQCTDDCDTEYDPIDQPYMNDRCHELCHAAGVACLATGRFQFGLPGV